MALTRMQQRRGPASDWTDSNAILASGEIGYETDTKKFKIGDGVSTWPTLPYFENEVDVAAAIQAAVDGILDLPPETLDTLNELAAALGDDPDFFNTVVYKAGSTMTGDLTLANDPTQPLHAATKQYVDSIEPMEPGGTTGQALVKASNDDYDVEWTTVAFDLNGLSDVDTSGAVDKNTLVYEDTTGTWVAGPGGGRFTVSETPPVDVLNGDTWLDSTTGNSYLYYEDYDNAQWIQIAGPNSVGAAGGSLTIATSAPSTPVDGDLWYDPTEGFTYIYYRDVDSSQWVQFGLNRNGAPGEPGADGSPGADGADGNDGVGIPSGGTSGQVLSKSSATDYDTEWADVASSASSLDELTDTTISSPVDGNSLVYNGSAWVNETLTTALNDVTDVTISSPIEGEGLLYNGTSWVNGAAGASSAGFNASQTITASDGAWAVPSLASSIVKVTVVGAGGGGGAGAGNSNTGNTGGVGNTTIVNAGVAGTVLSAGGPGGTATTTSARSGFAGTAGLTAGNGGGGGSATTSGVTAVQNSSNGGGGAISVAYLDLDGIATLNISIGAGGSGGTTSNGAPGGNGGRGEVIIEYVAA